MLLQTSQQQRLLQESLSSCGVLLHLDWLAGLGPCSCC
jgi:hypothetical protein